MYTLIALLLVAAVAQGVPRDGDTRLLDARRRDGEDDAAPDAHMAVVDVMTPFQVAVWSLETQVISLPKFYNCNFQNAILSCRYRFWCLSIEVNIHFLSILLESYILITADTKYLGLIIHVPHLTFELVCHKTCSHIFTGVYNFVESEGVIEFENVLLLFNLRKLFQIEALRCLKGKFSSGIEF